MEFRKAEYSFWGYNPDVELFDDGYIDHGHDLAEKYSRGKIGLKRETIEAVINILKENTPNKIFESGNQKQYFEILFGEFEKVGFKIKNYSKMGAMDLWDKYMGFMKYFGIIS